MDSKSIFQIPTILGFLWVYFLSLVAAFYLNMVQPVYQTTALININKEERKTPRPL
jgi:hypothetical protein